MTMPRQRGLTEQAADAAIDSACRLLRLPSIRNEFSDVHFFRRALPARHSRNCATFAA